MANSIGNLSVLISASTDGLSAGIRRAQALLNGFQSSASRLASGADSVLSGIGKGINLVNPFSGLIPSLDQLKTIGVATIGGLSAYSVKLASDAEQTKQSFEVMLGSAEKANKLVAEVKRFAAETPFGSTELIDASRQLIAYGTSAEQVIPTLRMLGDVSAGVGQPLGDITYLFGTLQTQGRAFTKDLYQFAGRGIPIYEALAKNLKVTTSEIGTLTEEGKIGFREVAQAFQLMTREGGKFGGLMDRQSKTIGGLVESLKDNVEIALGEIGQVLIEEFDLKNLVRETTDFVQNIKSRIGELRPFLRELADWAKAIGNALKVGFQSGVAAIQGFVTALNGAFDLGGKGNDLKDFLNGLEFDFRKARDVGVQFAEGLSIAIASILDVIEEVGLGIKKLQAFMIEADISQMALLKGDPAERKKLQSQLDEIEKYRLAISSREEFINREGKTLRPDQRGDTNFSRGIVDAKLKDETKLRLELADQIGLIDPAGAKKLREVADKLAPLESAFADFSRILKENPGNADNKPFMELLGKTTTQMQDLQSEVRGIVATAQTKIFRAMPEGRDDQILQREKDLRALRKEIERSALTSGTNVEIARAKFQDEKNKITIRDRREDTINKFGEPLKTIGSELISGPIRLDVLIDQKSMDTMQQQLSDKQFRLPVEVANSQQIDEARQLSKAVVSPVATLREEYGKLKKLLDLNAFGGNIAAGIPGIGSIDPNRLRGEDAVSTDLANKFRALESSLGDRSRLAAAVDPRSVQAASIEAQFEMIGQRADPNARVESVLKSIEEINNQQLIENRKLSDAIKAFLERQTRPVNVGN